MKKYIGLFIASCVLLTTSCDERFQEVNTDPNRPGPEVFDPNLLLPTASFGYGNLITGYTGSILFQSMWIQAFASTSTGGANYYSNGDKYVISGSTISYIQNAWITGFETASRINQMQQLAQSRDLTNLNAVGSIFRVNILSFLADIYGDIPFSEALRAEEGIMQPSYDSQADAYLGMLTMLEEAVNALNPAGDAIRNDIIYGGDIEKWRRFGNSLMFKMALRLVDVDPTLAQTWAQRAIAGGVFESADDDALVPSDEANGYANSSANALNVPDDTYEVRWSKVMIDYLRANNDPRLPIVAEVPPAGLAANRNGVVVGNNDPAIQIGLPNGFDMAGGQFDITNHPDFPGATGSGGDAALIGAYSRPTFIYRDREAPVFILTYAEIQLLLADAAVRGLVPGSAADYYRNGVEAGITSLSKFGGPSVSPSVAADHAMANTLDISSTEASLRMINEQIWATTSLFANFVEAWNNWKRSGYPELTPVNFPGNFSSGQIPRRQPFPASETGVNDEARNNAVARMGGDTWLTRIWWDGGN